MWPLSNDWSSYKEYGKESGLTDTQLLCELIGDRKALDLFLAKESDLPCMEAEKLKCDDVCE